MGMSPGLLRAREQYRVPNAITGVAISAFIVGVYYYSIMAVRQETFEDVDDEVRAMFAEGRREGMKVKEVATSAAPEPATVTPPQPPAISSSRGILSPVLSRALPGLVDPASKTLVWGAPPVDAVGKLSDRRRGPF